MKEMTAFEVHLLIRTYLYINVNSFKYVYEYYLPCVYCTSVDCACPLLVGVLILNYNFFGNIGFSLHFE